MKADDPKQRFKNALIYGTSHPEIYMTKADELWDRVVTKTSPNRDANHVTMFKSDFIAALKEYGELVKAEAVKVCHTKSHRNDDMGAIIAAAIKDMELP